MNAKILSLLPGGGCGGLGGCGQRYLSGMCRGNRGRRKHGHVSGVQPGRSKRHR